jgi:hypothetical protein
MPGSRFSLLCVLTAISTASGADVDGSTTQPAPQYAPASDPPHTGTPAPARARPLPFFYDLYTFRGRGGGTTVVTAFAVEAGRLETEGTNSGVRYRFSVTLVLADTAVRSVFGTHDTVSVDLRRPIDGDHLLYTHVEVQAPPSGTTRQRVIMTDATAPGIGQLYSDVFPIPDYSGSHLMLSDIALGHPDAQSGWTRGGVTLALLPTSQFPSSAFDVFYEVYNLPAGNEYTTEIAIEHSEDAAAGEPVRLRFVDESTAGRNAVLAELRRIETSLPRGSYRITVTVTDHATRQSASRSRSFEVRGWGREATMVAAGPHRSWHRPPDTR